MSAPRLPTRSSRQPFWIEVAELVVGLFSAVMLISFGGQVIVAPALLPVQWVIARHTSGWVSMAFSVLGALLTAEVIWLGWALLVGDRTAALIGGSVVALAWGAVFFRISRPKA